MKYSHIGGGVEDEMIDVIEMTIEECQAFTSRTVIHSPGSVLIAYYWFIHHKAQHCGNILKKQL